MSTATETNMMKAILTHFQDEQIPVAKLDAVQVSILGEIDGEKGTPAHYRHARTYTDARALHGSLPDHVPAPEGPHARAYALPD